MKLFLSYCHEDEKYLDAFLKHIAPLKQNGEITDWHDRKILAGERYQEKIDENMETSDIIAMFISADFLASVNCQKEIDKALSLKDDNGIDIMPIIVAPCSWKESKLQDFLACPTDGKAVDDWKNKNHAWVNVIKYLKDILACRAIKKKELTKDFHNFINDPGYFMGSNRGDILKLQGFYTYPFLQYQPVGLDDENQAFCQRKASFLTEFKSISGKTTIVLGDDWAGKTALCQIVCDKFLEAESDKTPVYIDGTDISNHNMGQIEKVAFEKQYKYLRHDSVDNGEKVIIFDNFAGEHMKEHDVYGLLLKIINNKYGAVILVANSMNAVFKSLKWRQFLLSNGISTYHISHANYNLRAEIIRRWMAATHKDEDITDVNRKEKLEDEYMQFVGLVCLDNTVPPYPSYIIMFLESRSGAMALRPGSGDDMSSYGHCYSALITHNLIKAGVSLSDTGEYHNILTQLAYYTYEKNVMHLSKKDVNEFRAQHKAGYMGLPDNFMDKLIKSALLIENFEGVRMQEYVFYYYVAKRLANDFSDDNLKDRVKSEIENIIAHSHRKGNSHILLFLVHHMPKNRYLLEKLRDTLDSLFSQFGEAKLTVEEIKPLRQFLDSLPVPEIEEKISENKRKENKETDITISESRDSRDTAMAERAEEQEYKGNTDNGLIQISKSFRMMKIVGSLIKNEYKTMEKEYLSMLSIGVRGVALRLISYGHKVIAQHPEIFESYLDNMISKKFNRWSVLSPQQKKNILTQFIGFLSVDVAHSMIYRCAWCIGSDKLTALIQEISEEKCPSYNILHLATSMWHGKKLDIKEIESMYEAWKHSNIMATRLIQQIVVNHLELNQVHQKQRQQLANLVDLDVKNSNLIEYKRRKN